LPKDINEFNYGNYIEESRDDIFFHPNKIKIIKKLNKEVGLYRTHCPKDDIHWMGEGLLVLQKILLEKREDLEENHEDSVVRYSAQEEAKKLLVQQQCVYFPQIIDLLQQFEKEFAAEYIPQGPIKIREVFSEQYTTRVLLPLIDLSPKVLALSDKDITALDSSHRKKQLHE
jgi:hypothetical protein